MADQAPVTFIDNPDAPELFADAASGIASFAGNIRLTFESARVDYSVSPGPVVRTVVGRLVMPLAAAENLRDLLISYLARVKAHGEPPPLPGRTKH